MLMDILDLFKKNLKGDKTHYKLKTMTEANKRVYS